MPVLETTGTMAVKFDVQSIVRRESPRPMQLLRELRDEHGPEEVESALSELIEEGAVVFGSDGHLRDAEFVQAV